VTSIPDDDYSARVAGTGRTDFSAEAAEWIAGQEWYASLGLPELPDDPAEARATREAGYGVLAECVETDGPVAVVLLARHDEEVTYAVPAREVAEALGMDAGDLAGVQFLAVMRETLEEGPVLSGFRPAPPRL
jgi:hypothetical protein